jgi:LTXXQ motif family protein
LLASRQLNPFRGAHAAAIADGCLSVLAESIPEVLMSKIVTAGLTALLIGLSSSAFAQAPAQAPAPGAMRPEGATLTAAELKAWTDRRIDLVKAALQLTPDQAKLWAPVEEAIRARATMRQQRIEALVNRQPGQVDPVQLLKERADNLTARGASLKKLADAWQPLYQTLTPEQKQRMRILAVYVLREMRDVVESHRAQMQDEEEED